MKRFAVGIVTVALLLGLACSKGREEAGKSTETVPPSKTQLSPAEIQAFMRWKERQQTSYEKALQSKDIGYVKGVMESLDAQLFATETLKLSEHLKELEAEKSKTTFEPVECAVATAGDRAMTELIDGVIQNAGASVDRNSGILRLSFDFDISRLKLQGQTSDPAEPKRFPPFHMLVRYFDKNGECLGHFKTKERFTDAATYDRMMKGAKDMKESGIYDPLAAQGASESQRLAPQGNIISYSVSMRDIAYVQAVEIGFCQ